MTKKEILRRKRIQREADVAEHNRLVRYRKYGRDRDKHYSRKESKDYEKESKMEPWRRLQKPENESLEDRKKRIGLGGETYIHSSRDDSKSRTLDEAIKHFKDREKSGEARITPYGRREMKAMQKIVDRDDYGLSPFEYNLKLAREAKNKKKKKKVKEEEAIDIRELIKKEEKKKLPKTSLDKDSKVDKNLYGDWL